jgi:hypothetical protein
MAGKPEGLRGLVTDVSYGQNAGKSRKWTLF